MKSKNEFFSFKNQRSKLAKCTVALDNCISVNLRQSSSQGNSCTSGIQMVTILTEKSNPFGIRHSIFSYGCNEAYKIRTSHQIRSRCSYIEAKSNNWPLRIPCGLLYGARRIRGCPAGNPRIIFWYLPKAPWTFLPHPRRVAYQRQEIIFRTIFSLVSTFPPPLSNSLLRLTL